MIRFTLVLFLTLAVGQTTLGARKVDAQQPVIPAAYRPPAGMCRIWIAGVPAAQQPAPTDCVTAVRNRPANGRVIFGDTPKVQPGKFKPVKPGHGKGR